MTRTEKFRWPRDVANEIKACQVPGCTRSFEGFDAKEKRTLVLDEFQFFKAFSLTIEKDEAEFKYAHFISQL
jgi:hypothetical protein